MYLIALTCSFIVFSKPSPKNMGAMLANQLSSYTSVRSLFRSLSTFLRLSFMMQTEALARVRPTRSTLMKSTPTKSTLNKSTSHRVNSHLINFPPINYNYDYIFQREVPQFMGVRCKNLNIIMCRGVCRLFPGVWKPLLMQNLCTCTSQLIIHDITVENEQMEFGNLQKLCLSFFNFQEQLFNSS